MKKCVYFNADKCDAEGYFYCRLFFCSELLKYKSCPLEKTDWISEESLKDERKKDERGNRDANAEVKRIDVAVRFRKTDTHNRLF